MNNLIDIGVNFTSSNFRLDLSQVISQAVELGVETMIVTGTDIGNSVQAINLCEQYPENLKSTVGIHPHHADNFNSADIVKIDELSRHQCVVALGEFGLDYNRNYSSQKSQLYCFEAQLEYACQADLPVFLHQRDAHSDFYKILKKYRGKLSRVVVHCFTGSYDELNDYLQLDAHIGITGWACDERRGHHLHELLCNIPSDRLLVETDAPYLLPRSLKPKPKSRRNEPKYLPHIVQEIANILNKDYDSLAAETTHAAQEFFGLNL
ncbi:Deoxyribonuclease TatD [hydrothermal vent metagenome]|uniref:Deoxyribonuclease TatD n=1 Tax=hydrothermal vent metagenome TaxID=652676 RepID=A0A3B1ABR7_9ZZZZ